MRKKGFKTDKNRIRSRIKDMLREEIVSKDGFIVDVSLKPKLIDESSFPISVLKTPKLSGLESITKFLRENRHLSYKEIGRLLNRNPGTLAVTYGVSKKKHPEKIDNQVELNMDRVDFSAFKKELSVLEAIAIDQITKGKTLSEIGRLIGKNPRTIWTVVSRAEKKLKEVSADE